MTEARSERVVDARFLEPPEPMERALEAIDELAPGECLRVLIHREPFPLYRVMLQLGYSRTTRELPDGTFEILFEPG